MSDHPSTNQPPRITRQIAWLLACFGLVLAMALIADSQQQQKQRELELQLLNADTQIQQLTDQLVQHEDDLAALTTQLAQQNTTRPGRLPVAGFYQAGQASWYGGKFHGRLTANGEKYDMNGFTAAHRLLPPGSHVRVTHLANGRSVVLRINDRGPYSGKRVLDVSQEAAERLGFIKNGVANVEIVGVPEQAWRQFVSGAQNRRP